MNAKTTVTCRTAYRGQAVIVTLKDGTQVNGIIKGFGRQIISLHTKDGFKQFSNISVSVVHAA